MVLTPLGNAKCGFGAGRWNGMGKLMPVFKISKDDRCKIFNITPNVYDHAQMLLAEAWNVRHDVVTRNEELRAQGRIGEISPEPSLPSWYHACKAVDPSLDFGKFFFLIDCADGDHGTHLTITVSNNVAAMLRRELGVALEFVHAVHHRPQDHPE